MIWLSMAPSGSVSQTEELIANEISNFHKRLLSLVAEHSLSKREVMGSILAGRIFLLLILVSKSDITIL
jgi:hypothetical protein